MGYVEGQGYYTSLNAETWHRDRWFTILFVVFLVGPAVVFVIAPFCLLGLSISYFVDRKISPGSVSRKPFHEKALLWFKSFIRFCIRFWRTGLIPELVEREECRAAEKRVPCKVCGTPVLIARKYRHYFANNPEATAICASCSDQRLNG